MSKPNTKPMDVYFIFGALALNGRPLGQYSRVVRCPIGAPIVDDDHTLNELEVAVCQAVLSENPSLQQLRPKSPEGAILLDKPMHWSFCIMSLTKLGMKECEVPPPTPQAGEDA